MDQDFTPVVLRKRQQTIKPILQKNATVVKPSVNKTQNKQNSDVPARKIDNESVKLPTSTNIKLMIQQKRNELKLSQEQLDMKCCFPKGTIKSYENGSAIVQSTQLLKINKILSSNVKKPKAQKLEEQ